MSLKKIAYLSTEVSDFFLFLRDEKKGSFYSLNNLRVKDSDAVKAQWLRVVLRNYLNRWYVDKYASIDKEYDIADEETSEMPIRDIRMASDLLSKINKTFPAPERYVFYLDL